jgi:UDP-glucose 4-epimerase
LKKVLVTGGTGYIGSHSVVELQSQGYDVYIIDNLSNSYEFVVDRITQISGIRPTFYKGSLTNADDLKSFFTKYGAMDAVIHFAAYKAVGESVENPLKYYHNNLSGLVLLLEAMEASGSKNIVFSSSCSVYGNTDVLPVTEDAPLAKAESPYGNTKRICEEILYDTTTTQKLACIALRYFNPVGAHPTALIGELPIGTPSNLIPVITQTAAGLRDMITIYGHDYPTVDGTCIRDYIHVVDLAKAHVCAVQRLINQNQKASYEVFNLGTGRGASVLEAIQTFEAVTGVKLNWQMGARRAGDVVQIWSDCKYSNEVLGWKTELSLAEALSSAWKWQQSTPELK